ncbi:MAG: acyl-CoA carboxylase epsilon subunit [Ornithinibacter sp.]
MTAGDETIDSGGAGAAVTAVPSAIVVRGEATPEQLAALVAVLSAASGGEEPASEQPGSMWAAHSVALRQPLSHGPGAWRTSLRS